MSGFIFWAVIAVIFVLLWWAGFYATKDMRVRKNAMREEQAKHNLELYAEQQVMAQDIAQNATQHEAVETKGKEEK